MNRNPTTGARLNRRELPGASWRAPRADAASGTPSGSTGRSRSHLTAARCTFRTTEEASPYFDRDPSDQGRWRRRPDSPDASPRRAAAGNVRPRHGSPAPSRPCRRRTVVRSMSRSPARSWCSPAPRTESWPSRAASMTAGPAAVRNVKISSLLVSDAVSPDGADLVANSVNNGFMTFERDAASGNLTQRSGPRRLHDDARAPSSTTACPWPADVAASRVWWQPAARRSALADQFYAVFLGVLRHRVQAGLLPALPQPGASDHQNTSVAIAFGCSDRNGDPLSTTWIDRRPISGNLGAIDQAGATRVLQPVRRLHRRRQLPVHRHRRDARDAPDDDLFERRRGAWRRWRRCGSSSRPGSTTTRTGSSPARTATTPTRRSGPAPSRSRATGLDENCDGLAEPFPTLTSGVASNWDVKGTRLTLRHCRSRSSSPRGGRP